MGMNRETSPGNIGHTYTILYVLGVGKRQRNLCGNDSGVRRPTRMKTYHGDACALMVGIFVLSVQYADHQTILFARHCD